MRRNRKSSIAIIILIILLLLSLSFNVKLNITLGATTNQLNQTSQKLQQTQLAYEDIKQKVSQLNMERSELMAQLEKVEAQREYDKKVLSGEIREKNEEISVAESKPELTTQAKVFGAASAVGVAVWSYLKVIPKVIAVP